MNRGEFEYCINEAKRMFHLKDISSYVLDIFFEMFASIEKNLFLKAAALTAASGTRFTIDNIANALNKIRNDLPKQTRTKSNCTRCGGDGAIVANNYAYSCNCVAGKNHPNYPKYNGQTTKGATASEMENFIYREFYDYKITTSKDINSVSQMSFEHPKGA